MDVYVLIQQAGGGFEVAVMAESAEDAVNQVLRRGNHEPAWTDTPDDWYDSDIAVEWQEIGNFKVYGPY